MGFKRERNDPFYTSKPWRRLRLVVLKRDHFRCVVCGSDVSALGAARIDHILPRSSHPELELSPRNLRTLCVFHDGQAHIERLHPRPDGQRTERFGPARRPISVDGWPEDLS
jgi:5-methylcytosine-specific restriction endonuclease McrA